jgi:hypothetical protein
MMKVRRCRVHCSQGSTCCVSRIRVLANAECNVHTMLHHDTDMTTVMYCAYFPGHRKRDIAFAKSHTRIRK